MAKRFRIFLFILTHIFPNVFLPYLLIIFPSILFYFWYCFLYTLVWLDKLLILCPCLHKSAALPHTNGYWVPPAAIWKKVWRWCSATWKEQKNSALLTKLGKMLFKVLSVAHPIDLNYECIFLVMTCITTFLFVLKWIVGLNFKSFKLKNDSEFHAKFACLSFNINGCAICMIFQLW